MSKLLQTLFWLPNTVANVVWPPIDLLRLRAVGIYLACVLRIERLRSKRTEERTRRRLLSDLQRPSLSAIRQLTDEELGIALDLVGLDPLAQPLWEEWFRRQRRGSDEQR